MSHDVSDRTELPVHVPHADVPCPGPRTYNGRTFSPLEMASAARGSDAWLAAVHGQPVPAAGERAGETPTTAAEQLAAAARRVLESSGDSLPALRELDGALVAYEAAKAACGVYEVTLAGFDGGTDATDDRVLWIEAPNEQLILAHLPAGSRVQRMDFAPPAEDVDHVLPADAAKLREHVARVVRSAGGDVPVLYTAETFAVANTGETGWSIKLGDDTVADVYGDEDAARRIAASLNACKELCVGSLERGGIAQMIRGANAVIHSVHSNNRQELEQLVDGLHEDVTDLVLPDVVANEDEPEGMRP